MEKEYRFLRQSELRATGDVQYSGYSAVFNVPSLPLGPQRYREYIRPGAFTRSLDGDVVGLYNHDPANVLGRTSAGTMALAQDATGLKTTIDLPPTQLGRDTHALIKRGDFKGMFDRFFDNARPVGLDAHGAGITRDLTWRSAVLFRFRHIRKLRSRHGRSD